MNNEIENLGKWVKSIKVDETLLIVIKFVSAIIAGAFTGFLIKELNTENSTVLKWWHYSIWFLALALALFIEIRKANRDNNFPVTLLAHLRASQELDTLKASVDRNETVNGYLVDVVSRLNGQTCNLSRPSQEALCTNGIITGISDLLQPVIENMHFILGSQTVKPVSCGIYLESCIGLTNDKELKWERKVLTLPPDKLDLLHSIQRNLDSEDDKPLIPSLSGTELKIMNTIRMAYADRAYNEVSFGDYTMVACPIIKACNDDAEGVFFAISTGITISNDVETHLTIFNTIVANWLYRYGDCVLNQHYRAHPKEKAKTEVWELENEIGELESKGLQVPEELAQQLQNKIAEENS